MSELQSSPVRGGSLPEGGKRRGRLARFIASRSVWTEFCVVLGLAFVIWLPIDIWRSAHGEHYVFSNALLLRGTAFKVVIFGVVLWIGRTRGWSPRSFGVKISWRGTLGGIVLHVIVVATGVAMHMLLEKLHLGRPNYSSVPMAFPVVLLASIVNPIYEEVLEAGYIINRLQGLGPWVGVGASAVFRGVVHLYQGVNGMIETSVFGLVMGLAYWRYRQLWPLVLAHGTHNFISFIID